jgi:integral membrane protein (TIGR00529 family)
VPAVAKILIVFVGMLVLTRARVPLGLAVLAGGIALDFWSGQETAAVAGHLGTALASADVWLMIGITALVVEFGRYVTEKENAEALLAVTKRWGGRHGRAAAVMAAPAMVGLIPMPAGALFSAPLVEQAAAGADRTGAWKTAVNYWFRHIWEYWWPIYPGVILAMSIFQMENWQFFLTQIPFSLVSVGAGYLFLVRRHVDALAAPAVTARVDRRRAVRVVLPLVLVVVSVMLLPVVLGQLWPSMAREHRKMLAMLTGLLAGLALIVQDETRRGCCKAFGSLATAKSLNILTIIGGVMVFQHMLKASGTVTAAAREMQAGHVPFAVVVAVLPLLAGLTTGVAVGFVGASLPLVVGLMAVAGSPLTPMATLSLAYAFGYMGMMLSPLHLCFLVTREYFSTTFAGVYRRIWPCVAAVFAWSLLSHLVYRALGW